MTDRTRRLCKVVLGIRRHNVRGTAMKADEDGVYSFFFFFLLRLLCFFFFQAEDGIRDIGVTGVQTCALPI